MSNDIVTIAIVALLPLTALLLVLQTNPYRALIVRGVLGAIAALVYALFGAADVALTEALVGTLLSMTLYAIAIRSSLPAVQSDSDQPPSPPTTTLAQEDS
ncbi:MAG: hydrogenase subunit MbhD domain-containing protein [Phormidesmis sp.]